MYTAALWGRLSTNNSQNKFHPMYTVTSQSLATVATEREHYTTSPILPAEPNCPNPNNPSIHPSIHPSKQTTMDQRQRNDQNTMFREQRRSRLRRMFFVPSYFKKKSKESKESKESNASVGRIKTSVIVESAYPVPSLRVVPIQSFSKKQQENGEPMGRIFCGAGDTAFELSLLKRHYSSDGRIAKFHTPLPTTTTTTTTTVAQRQPLSKATTTTTSTPTSTSTSTATSTATTQEEEEFQERVQEYEIWNETIEFVAAELANVPETLRDEVCVASRESGTSKAEQKAFDHAVMDLMLMS
jgi:hypothetical protein